jgi:hypothetical protein
VFAADHQAQVVIYVKNRVTVVLPNKEIDLGELEPEGHIMVDELDVPLGKIGAPTLGRLRTFRRTNVECGGVNDLAPNVRPLRNFSLGSPRHKEAGRHDG